MEIHFGKHEFAMVEIFVGGNKKLTRLDKKLKHRLYFFKTHLNKNFAFCPSIPILLMKPKFHFKWNSINN